MRPYINDKPLRSLSVPKLSGGVNYRDGISQVLDNQLTDCRNVWYKNGILQTRPGIRCINDNDTVTDYHENTSEVKTYAKKENFRVVDGNTYFLVAIQTKDAITFTYYPENSELTPVHVATITSENLPPREADYTCNIFQYNADILCFCSGYYEGQDTPYYIFKISDEGKFNFKAPLRITDELSEEEGGFYVPTIIMNGKTQGDMEIYESFDIVPKGDYLEGFNLLGNRYRMFFSTVNKELFQGNNEDFNQASTYPLFYPVKKGDKVTVNVVLPTRFPDESYGMAGDYKKFTHEVVITDEKDLNLETKGKRPDDGIYIGVIGKRLCLFNWDASDREYMYYKEDDFVDYNNLEIIAPCPNSKENYEKVLNMTTNEWFGGGSEGIYGGIHLFMGGNTGEKEKALVCWSDFNKPLYFSENCYAYVGDKAQRVTAFGKQGESLMIFKERELYATQYSSLNSAIDADSAINQSVVDVTASEVIFPMIQVHGFIGCDCPNTVQLCRNRLVWAHSDRKIYTLTSASQWNERSVYEVSGMIESLLQGITSDELKAALSADWEGHYILSVGDKFLVMDYNSYGYAHIYSYTKEDDAQMHIPWWIWDKPLYPQKVNTVDVGITTTETPINVISLVTVGEKLYLWTEAVTGKGPQENMQYYRIPEPMCFDGTDDKVASISFESNPETSEQYRSRDVLKKEIPAMAQTKLFDFGSPTVQKSIPKAEVSFGNNEGVPITVTTITDRGEASKEIILDFEETDSRSPQFFKNVAIRNSEKLNNRIGYRFESNGNIFLDSISVYFKLLGGSK